MIKKRRIFVVSASLFAAALFVTACSSGGSGGSGGASASGGKEFAGQTLTVLGEGADVNTMSAQGMDAQFTAETGANIQWISGSAPDNLAKILAAKNTGSGPPAEVVSLDNTTQPIAAAAGAIQKLDYQKLLPSYSEFAPSAWIDPGYGPAYDAIRLGYCYNTNVFKQLGLPAPAGVNVLFNPKLKGKIALADTTNFYWEATMPAFGVAMGTSLNNPAPLMQKFKSIDAQTLFTSSSQGQQLVQSGSVAISEITDGRCLALKLKGQPVNLAPLNLNVNGKTYPYVGLADTIDVVSGISSEQTQLALKFINLYTKQGVLNYFKISAYNSPRADTEAELADDPAIAPLVKGFDPAQLYYPDIKSFEPHQQAWINSWNQIVT